MHDYSPEKIVEFFKRLGCEFYISKDRINVEFPGRINGFYVIKLRVAFKKANCLLYKYLFKGLTFL